MVEFKAKADKIIKERWGLEVEHVCATSNLNPGKRLSFEDVFYRPIKNSKSKITSNAAERERESMVGRCGKGTGVPATSSNRLSDKVESVVYGRTQKATFPTSALHKAQT